MPSKDVWNERYRSERMFVHARQNDVVSSDLLDAIRDTGIRKVLSKAAHIVEIGCGTGELGWYIHGEYRTPQYDSMDISSYAIEVARKREFVGPRFSVGTFDDIPACDLTISQSVLEHFEDPFVPLNKMLAAAPYALIVVPYDETITEPDGPEGGLRHKSSWNEDFLLDYKVVDEVKFQTDGWVSSSSQFKWAVLLAR